MKTDFDTVLKILRDNKSKRIKDGFTTLEFSESIGKSIPQAGRILREMVRNGIAAFSGKALRQGINGEMYPAPTYKLIKQS